MWSKIGDAAKSVGEWTAKTAVDVKNSAISSADTLNTDANRSRMKTAAVAVCVGGAVAVAAPVVVGAAAGALGFSSTGIAAGSTAATWMSWGGGTTPAFVSVLQQVGTTGISYSMQALCGVIGGGATAVIAGSQRAATTAEKPSSSSKL